MICKDSNQNSDIFVVQGSKNAKRMTRWSSAIYIPRKRKENLKFHSFAIFSRYSIVKNNSPIPLFQNIVSIFKFSGKRRIKTFDLHIMIRLCRDFSKVLVSNETHSCAHLFLRWKQDKLTQCYHFFYCYWRHQRQNARKISAGSSNTQISQRKFLTNSEKRCNFDELLKLFNKDTHSCGNYRESFCHTGC